MAGPIKRRKFAGYGSPQLPNDKTLIKHFNATYLNDYMGNINNDTGVKVYPPSVLPGRLVGQPAIYKKTRAKRSGNCQLAFVQKDGEYHSFLWRATEDELDQALSYGILDPEKLSLTGKVISMLGQYRLITLERVQEGGVSNRYLIKEALITHTQQRIKGLSELESIANQYALHDKPALHAQQLQTIDNYIDNLNKLRDLVPKKFSLSALRMDIHTVDPFALANMQKELNEDIKRAKKLRVRFARHPGKATRATGKDSILTFVKEQMARDLRRLQNHNQNITYTRNLRFALTRGDLNSCAEDAVKVVEDYKAPPHDSAFYDHHAAYANKESTLMYDSASHCKSEHQEKRALLAISFISGLNKIVYPRDPEIAQKFGPGIQAYHQPLHRLQVISATKWGVNGGFFGGVKRVFAFGINIALKLILGAIELPITLFLEPLLVDLPYLFLRKFLDKHDRIAYLRAPFKYLRYAAMWEIKIANKKAPTLGGEHWFKLAYRHHDTFGLRVRQLATNAFRNTIQDIFYGIRDLYKQFTVRLFDSVIDDYAYGSKKFLNQSLDNVLANSRRDLIFVVKCNREDLTKQLDKLYKDNKTVDWQEIVDELYPAPDTPNVKDYKQKAANATPASKLDTGEFNDAISAAREGFDSFMAFFLHNIHAKHPAVGAVFTSTYLLAGFSVLFPAMAERFLSPGFIAYCQALGYGMSKSPQTAAISAGCTLAQMASSGPELILNGKKSWIANSALSFEKDPFTSIIYAGTAVALGVVLFNVPGIRDVLIEDMGTFPPSSLAFLGAKLGLIVYEILAEHSEWRKYDAQSNLELDETIIKQIMTDPRLRSELAKIQLLHFFFTEAPHLTALSPKNKNALHHQLQKHFKDAPEVAKSLTTMLYPNERQSILRTTVSVIFGYPAYILRALVAVVSSIIQMNGGPLEHAMAEFADKLLKDVTRLSRAMGGFFKVGVTFIRRHAKVVGDVILNSGFGRAEAIILNTHEIANKAYAISGALDAAYERLRQWVGTPIDKMVHEVTEASPIDTQRKTYDTYSALLEEFKPIKKARPVTVNFGAFDKQAMAKDGPSRSNIWNLKALGPLPKDKIPRKAGHGSVMMRPVR